MTCEEHCLHWEVCKLIHPEYATAKYYTFCSCAEKCECFKNKSKYIELPCKVGDECYIVQQRCTRGGDFDELTDTQVWDCEEYCHTDKCDKEWYIKTTKFNCLKRIFEYWDYFIANSSNEHFRHLYHKRNEAEAKLKELNNNAE